MLFTTVTFAYFMAILFLIYYIVPAKFRWMVLLAGNGYFYYQTGYKSFLFMIGTIILSYTFGILIEKTGKKSYIMWLAVLFVVSILVVMRTSLGKTIAPVGLSFYSMITLGYCIDVHRGSVKAQRNIFKYALFVSFFPHVIQGPFSDYNELSSQLFAEHKFDYNLCVRGMYRICFGLMKKLIIADRITYIIDDVYVTGDGYFGLTLLFVLCLYSIQLYCDFSGYVDISAGCSNLLGIKLQENFNVPYMAKSMAEFWRRWHMSLGLWFKNYVFFPVQRTKLCNSIRKYMKKKKNKYGMNVLPSVIGLVLVWTLIGLWHGFNWNYLLYDWTCGLIIIFSELIKPVYDKVNGLAPKVFKSKFMDFLRIVRTFLLVTLTFLWFRPTSVSVSVNIFKNMFLGVGLKTCLEFMYWHSYDLFLISFPLIILFIVDAMKYRNIDVCQKLHKLNPVLRYGIYVAGLVLIYVCKGDRSAVAFAYSIF